MEAIVWTGCYKPVFSFSALKDGLACFRTRDKFHTETVQSKTSFLLGEQECFWVRIGDGWFFAPRVSSSLFCPRRSFTSVVGGIRPILTLCGKTMAPTSLWSLKQRLVLHDLKWVGHVLTFLLFLKGKFTFVRACFPVLESCSLSFSYWLLCLSTCKNKSSYGIGHALPTTVKAVSRETEDRSLCWVLSFPRHLRVDSQISLSVEYLEIVFPRGKMLLNSKIIEEDDAPGKRLSKMKHWDCFSHVGQALFLGVFPRKMVL